MSDDKKKKGSQDRAKVGANDPGEVGYVARKLGTSAAKIHEAIKEVGNGRKKIEGYVKNPRGSRFYPGTHLTPWEHPSSA